MSTRTAGWYLGARAAAALMLLATLAIAAPPPGSSVSFAYPPAPTAGSLTANTVDSVYVEWTSNYAEAFLYFYCNTGPNAGTETVFHQSVSDSGNAMVSLAGQGPLESRSDWSTPLRCWFDLNYADKGGQGIGALVVSVTSIAAEATTYSPGFAQTSESPSSSSVPPASSPAGTTASQIEATNFPPITSITAGAGPSATGNRATVVNAQSSATSASTATNPPTLSGTATASTTTGISAGTAAGIAIGALGGAGAIAAIAILLYRRRKQNKQNSYVSRNYGNEARKYGNEDKPYGVAVAVVQQQHREPAPRYEAPTHEMQGTQPQELSALNYNRASSKEKRY